MSSRKHFLPAVPLCLALIATVTSVPARAESIRLSEERQKAVQTAAEKKTGDKTPALKCESAADRRAVNDRSADSAKKTAAEKDEKQPAAPSSSATTQEIVTATDCDQQQIETVNLCDVTGTVCENCGDIVLASAVLPEYAEIAPIAGGGGISPLFALAAVPLAFIPLFNGDDSVATEFPTNVLIPGGNPNVTPINPVPPDGPAPVPEPLSLLLFGSGLAGIGTFLRRRRRASDRDQIDTLTEGEVN